MNTFTENYGFSNKDPVTDHPFIFYPIDEPHGMIKVKTCYCCILRIHQKS